MQTWILTGLLVLSLFANGYLFAQRSAPPAPLTPDAALVADLQRLMDGLDTEPEWRHRLVSLGRFAETRNERRLGQKKLLHAELFGLLTDSSPNFEALNDALENLTHEDAHYRMRVVEQFVLLLRDLDTSRRIILLERMRLMEIGLDDFTRLALLQP